MTTHSADIVVIGAGIVGIACAYYSAMQRQRVLLIDSRAPMSLTSAQSGENYRNWWPHPTMVAFTDYSTTLMERIARDTDNRINLTRRGYALATRRHSIDDLIEELHAGYGEQADVKIRSHSGDSSAYIPPTSTDWQTAPDGVDVLQNCALIRRTFPTFTSEIKNVIHIRRAGDVSGQQLGQSMLEFFREEQGHRLVGRVVDINKASHFTLGLENGDRIESDAVVNAAGPYLGEVAQQLDLPLPITNILQQKIAFEDREKTILRDMPFAIDLDARTLDWTGDERQVLGDDSNTQWLTEPIAGGIHCRPDGGDTSAWIKLGWAFNEMPVDVQNDPQLNPHFPDIVLRGASALNPALKTYYGRLPASARHYGGYYTMTQENWPLIGPTQVDGFFVAGALSGFGTMAACATGSICAAWVLGHTLPEFAQDLSLTRYTNASLMASLLTANRGVL